ncbi:Ig-like domain-containing protein [Streptomyces sp. NPDC048196]|uniref:Ig-like domain-containing protein n=1 Tax=Streptomyces sp. NPDC048196 TaxID=3154712 RepID=UPI00340F6AEE
MAGDPSNASLWTDADVYIGPLSAVNPTNANAPFGSDWGLVGLLDGDDGMPESRDEDTDDKYAWGGILVRTSRAHFKLTKSFSVLEDNPTTRSLIWPGSSETEIVVPVPVPVKVGFEVRDSGTGKVHRLITRRYAVIEVDGDVDQNETDLTKVTLAATIYPDSDKVLFDRQTTPVLSSISVSPSSASVVVGDIAALTATATYDDSSTQDVTSAATWTSSAPSKATVSAGFVTGVAAGSSTVTAAYSGKTSSCSVTVTSS